MATNLDSMWDVLNVIFYCNYLINNEFVCSGYNAAVLMLVCCRHGLFNPLNTVLNDDPLKSWKVLLKWKPLQTETDYRLWLSRLRLFPTQVRNMTRNRKYTIN